MRNKIRSILVLTTLILLFQNCTVYKAIFNPQISKAITPNEYEDLQILSGNKYKNPIINDSGDPHVLKHGKKYYIYLPHNTKKNGVSYGNYRVYTSNDLVNWDTSNIKTLFNKDTFINDTLWAPDIYYHKDDNKFYLYYTLVKKSSQTGDVLIGEKDIGIATSSSPTGPFEILKKNNKPFILLGNNDSMAYIDPNMFRDDDGRLYLVYKYRNSGGSKIYLQPMNSPSEKLGSPKLLISNDNLDRWENTHPNNKLTWEKTVTIEQPYLTKAHGFYYLFYSANQGETVNYGIGVLRSDSINKVFFKPAQFYNNPVVGKIIKDDITKSVLGPGAASIVKDSYNRRWLVYRQKNNTDVNWNRSICMDRIEFTKSGLINITPSRETFLPSPITDKYSLDTQY